MIMSTPLKSLLPLIPALALVGCADRSETAASTEANAGKADVTNLTMRADADVTWYPAPTWCDMPDPIASPAARKGGVLRFDGASSPNSFNAYVDTSSYVQMMFALMYPSLVVTDTETLDFVPSLAKRWSVSKDETEYTFVLDERARWSDGVPVTACDVKWTFDQVMAPKSDSGYWKLSLGSFEKAEVVDAAAERPLIVRFTKRRDKDGSVSHDWRDLTHCGLFYILPKHHFENQEFNKFDFVGAPVCGPYRIVRMAEQVETEYARVADWWRADFPSCRNTCNFDRIIMRYYGSKENAFHAFKKGIIDVYPVYSARIMATETSGPKFERNWIIKRRVSNHEPMGFQGFAMNMRRPPFDDLRVRKAMAKLIDRERLNHEMMYDEYFLQRSYFGDLYDADHEGAETCTNPAHHHCRNPFYLFDFEGAKALLAEAGYVRNEASGKLEKDGVPFTFTFLSRDGNTAYLTRFNESLRQLGIEMKIDNKDFASWMRDMDAGNFDMTWASYGASLFRMPEIAWRSSEADRKGSGNRVGFKSEEVDRLIDEEKVLKTFAEREAVYRRIDSIVAEQCPYAFLWNIAAKRLLYWNKFGMPAPVLSRYNNEADVLTYWWYDNDRAEELTEAMRTDAYLPSVPELVSYDAVMEGAAR